MIKLLLILVSITALSSVTYSQDFSSCFNGIKDSSELEVDCYRNNSGLNRSFCNLCNGVSSIKLNGKEYKTGVVSTNAAEIESPGVFNANRKSSYMMFQSRFFSDGSPQRGFTLTFTIDAHPLKVKEYRLGYGLRSEFTCSIWYHLSNGVMELQKIKKGEFAVTSVDNIERKLNASFTLDGKLADGSPIFLTGTFTNVGY